MYTLPSMVMFKELPVIQSVMVLGAFGNRFVTAILCYFVSDLWVVPEWACAVGGLPGQHRDAERISLLPLDPVPRANRASCQPARRSRQHRYQQPNVFSFFSNKWLKSLCFLYYAVIFLQLVYKCLGKNILCFLSHWNPMIAKSSPLYDFRKYCSKSLIHCNSVVGIEWCTLKGGTLWILFWLY